MFFKLIVYHQWFCHTISVTIVVSPYWPGSGCESVLTCPMDSCRAPPTCPEVFSLPPFYYATRTAILKFRTEFQICHSIVEKLPVAPHCLPVLSRQCLSAGPTPLFCSPVQDPSRSPALCSLAVSVLSDICSDCSPVKPFLATQCMALVSAPGTLKKLVVYIPAFPISSPRMGLWLISLLSFLPSS